ncbi:MAG: hypothetical protein PHN69_03140 [Candidatus Pacebacteria bacterium]|nr:hypothetical protein [Candidatus Paceibacterota bacterium]
MKMRNKMAVKNYNANLTITSETRVREALEKVVDSIILVDSLEEIMYHANDMEYREYRLMSKSDGQGIDYGGIEDVMTVFSQWKEDGMDKTLRVFLEYEVYDFHVNTLMPTGISRQVGLVLKIVK